MEGIGNQMNRFLQGVTTLQTCQKCGRAKVVELPIGSTITVLCDCDNKDYFEMRDRELYEELAAISVGDKQPALREKNTALADMGFQRMGRVDNWDPSRAPESSPPTACLIDRLCELYSKPDRTLTRGFVLCSRKRLGKTTLLERIALQRLDAGNTVLCCSLPELYGTINQAVRFEKKYSEQYLLDLIAATDTIVLDGIGARKPTEWQEYILSDILDHAVRRGALVIGASAFASTKLKTVMSGADGNDRAWSLLSELCKFIDVE